jgi:hyperosmotically inducible protein
MRTSLISFLVGLIVGIVGYWYFAKPESQHAVSEAQEAVRSNVVSIGHSIKETLDTDKIKDELARTGKVIREKASKVGEVVVDKTADARITTTIKAKLLKESSLDSLKIHVETTDGVVTLSGAVGSHEEIAKAMEIALETDGVQKVISTLQVKPK